MTARRPAAARSRRIDGAYSACWEVFSLHYPASLGVDIPQSAEAGALVGRSAELSLLGAFADRARTDGAALLLRGEPGVGKTALLHAAADAASTAGAQVLRVAGVQFEADMAFSALHQALYPLHDEFEKLSAVHRDALNAALGFGEGQPPRPLVVCNAALTALCQAAAVRPVLLIADDLPWLDRASAKVLGFVARRVAGSHVGLLAALRSGEESFFERAGLCEHELQPLGERAASDLLSSRFPRLPGRVRELVLAQARGNPLALLELPPSLAGRQPAAPAGSPLLLPMSRRLQQLFASRITRLPARTRRLLLLMALDATGD